MAEEKNRRQFVKTAAQVAVAAPTVAILMNGSAKALTEPLYGNSAPGPGDDFVGFFADDAGADDGTVTISGDDFVP